MKPSDSLNDSILKGVSWNSLSTVVTQVINILTFVILAKFFLEPSDFGLVAIIVVLTGFGSLFTELGLSASLIQKQEVNNTLKSSIFWLSLALGICVYTIFLLLRTSISEFYDRPILHEMITLISLTLLIAASSSVHIALLKKNLKFKLIAIITITANILSGCVAILMASFEFGPWALVGKALVFQFFFSVLAWVMCSWRPAFIFNLKAVKEVLNFSFHYFGTTIFTNVVTKSDELLIGKIAGESSLGLYSNALRLVLMPVTLIKNQIISVFFPVLSTIQKDHERVKKIVLQLSGGLALLGFPILFFIAASAKDLIELLLNENWLDMELMVVLLSFIAMFEITIFPGVIFLSQGHADKYFRLMIYTKSVSVFLFSIGMFINSVTGLLIGMLLAAILNFIPYIYFSGKLIDMSVYEQLKVNVPPFIISIMVATLIKLSELWMMSIPLSSLTVLITKFSLFFIMIASSYIILQPYPYKKLRLILKRKQ